MRKRNQLYYSTSISTHSVRTTLLYAIGPKIDGFYNRSTANRILYPLSAWDNVKDAVSTQIAENIKENVKIMIKSIDLDKL